MSESKRLELRKAYIQGWYQLDANLLLSTTASDFIFDDSQEPEPITRSMLPDYMLRWDAKTRAMGANNEWILTQELTQDADHVLTNWEWWELIGTALQGSAVVLTSDEGVFLERITYFDRARNFQPEVVKRV